MTNPYYAHGEQRAQKVHALFSAIARRYDLINDIQSFGMHRGWKKRLVALAGVKSGDNVLDICCGTGDVAFAFAAKGVKSTGLDFTREMIAVAERRKGSMNQSTSRTNPTFIHGDAMNLPFAENSFDAVTVGYGLRNLANWEKG